MVPLLLHSKISGTFAVGNFASIMDRIQPWPWISSSSSPYFRKYLNSWNPPSSGIEYQQTRQATGRPATQINNNWCTASFSLNINPTLCRRIARSHKLEESKAAVIAWTGNFRKKIREVLKTLCQSPTLNRDRGFEVLVLYGDVLARSLVHSSSMCQQIDFTTESGNDTFTPLTSCLNKSGVRLYDHRVIHNSANDLLAQKKVHDVDSVKLSCPVQWSLLRSILSFYVCIMFN